MSGVVPPVNHYSEYLRRRYGEAVYRVAVDVGFSCPGRDRGTPCAYCDAAGSRAPYLQNADGLGDQIDAGIAFLTRRYGARRFILFFQAHTNTYAPVDRLRRIYDEGLSRANFCGLAVATRPDCLDEERAGLLASYRDRSLDVWVELGLQSVRDDTLERMGRGHTLAQFDRAVALAQRHGLFVAAHVILGLPGEGVDDAVATAAHLSSLRVDGVKFHNLVITKGTRLYEEYVRGECSPPSVGEYLNLLVAALCRLDPRILVMRLTCDPRRQVDHHPVFPDKQEFYRMLAARMRASGTTQGVYWSSHADEG